MKTILLSTVLALVTIFGSACRTHQGAYAPLNSATVEQSAKFVLLDRGAQRSVGHTGIQERLNEEGRLEVVVNLLNRENRRIEVQANCVFKDAHGFSTGDETPFQTVILTENAQETLRFVSGNDKARSYTIRVRQAR